MNLSGRQGESMVPFFRHSDDRGQPQNTHLINGERYDVVSHHNSLFFGITPFEASNNYSDQLKETIFQCLDYRQHKRGSFTQLKSITSTYAGKKLPRWSRAYGDLIIMIPKDIESLSLGEKIVLPRTDKKKRKRNG